MKQNNIIWFVEKRKLKKEEEILESKVNGINYKVQHSPNKATMEVLEQLANFNKQVEDVRAHTMRSTILREENKMDR